MMFLRFISILLFFIITSCANPPQTVTRDSSISIEEANQKVTHFLEEKNMDWGKPTSIRNAPGRYLYLFHTPTSELREKGQRMLKVDIRSGKVSVPLEGGLY